MILVRDIMRVKYGKMRDAKQALHEMNAATANIMPDRKTRVLTDLTGPAYTLVIENEFPSLSHFENNLPKIFESKEWQEAYQKFSPHIESSHREVFTIVE